MEAFFKFLKSRKPCYIIIAILIIALIFTQQCGGDNDEEQTYSSFLNFDYFSYSNSDTIYYHDTVFVPNYKPYPVPGATVYVPVPADVDTNAILARYYYSYFYLDTAINDTSAFLLIQDQISMNQIQSRQVQFVNRRPSIINTTTTTITPTPNCPEQKQFNLGFGGMIGGWTDKFGAGPSIIVTTNKHSSYAASYDAINKIAYFSLYYNVK